MKVHCLLPVALWLYTADLGSTSERCDDWGVDTMKHKPVYNGEPTKIKCPLFEAFLKYNYTTAHAAGLTLIWYRIGQGKDLEEPINFRPPDNRISKEKDTLWFRPALLNDTGNYTCMLRNTTYCSKVAFPVEVVNKDPGSCVSQAMKPNEVLLYLDHTNINLSCPDVEGYYPAKAQLQVKWYMNCRLVLRYTERFPAGLNLTFGWIRESYAGDYTCIATYRENSRDFSLTRTLRVKVVGPPENAKLPLINSPNDRVTYEVKTGDNLELPCNVYFTFVKGPPPEVWWLIDGRNTDDITDLRINVSEISTPLPIGDKQIERTLFLTKLKDEDFKRNYTCCARNPKGEVHKQAIVKRKEDSGDISFGASSGSS